MLRRPKERVNPDNSSGTHPTSPKLPDRELVDKALLPWSRSIKGFLRLPWRIRDERTSNTSWYDTIFTSAH